MCWRASRAWRRSPSKTRGCTKRSSRSWPWTTIYTSPATSKNAFFLANCHALEGYKFYHFYKAARQIGGDFFDYIALPDDRLAVVVADVSGKGIPAALMMAKMSAETRYVLVSERDPAAALKRLNTDFCEAGWEDRFVTMAVAVIDLARHEVQIVNAGHMAPFLRRSQGESYHSASRRLDCHWAFRLVSATGRSPSRSRRATA